mmetsp:Transcript_61098/g.69970  ORF Transcript_61098/g.69970 Transcript_61098/m.69970 type:complete len:147 (-) Transcript_61098:446-886(-)
MGCGTSTEVKKSMQSQDRKIQRLMELNTDLTSKLQNAENLTAKQNTEISQLQEMITGRFNELENRLQETLVSRRTIEKTDFMADRTIGSSDDNGVTGGVASSHQKNSGQVERKTLQETVSCLTQTFKRELRACRNLKYLFSNIYFL